MVLPHLSLEPHSECICLGVFNLGYTLIICFNEKMSKPNPKLSSKESVSLSMENWRKDNYFEMVSVQRI